MLVLPVVIKPITSEPLSVASSRPTARLFIDWFAVVAPVPPFAMLKVSPIFAFVTDLSFIFAVVTAEAAISFSVMLQKSL